MPVPSPHQGEDEQAFVSRCMGDDTMKEYEQEQRAAICYRQWRTKDEAPAQVHGKTWYTFRALSEETTELLLYDEIGESFYGGISAKAFAEDLKKVKNSKLLTVRINSVGGSVFDGTAIYNQLSRFPGKVEVDIDGLAASIASVIALAGRPVRM